MYAMKHGWTEQRRSKQMNRSYFQSLSQERLVEVADNLHQLATFKN